MTLRDYLLQFASFSKIGQRIGSKGLNKRKPTTIDKGNNHILFIN